MSVFKSCGRLAIQHELEMIVTAASAPSVFTGGPGAVLIVEFSGNSIQAAKVLSDDNMSR